MTKNIAVLEKVRYWDYNPFMIKKTSKLRIIGGKWRSRKISFLPLKGVRPTTDMVRETVFNWLAPFVGGARCLDLFAGSGALGFEALSRGAPYVVMADANAKIVSNLKQNAKLLQAKNIDFYIANIPRQLHRISEQTFDIVFIDPPFGHDLVQQACNGLIQNNLLSEKAYIYIESEKNLGINSIIPKNWRILKNKRFGALQSYLLGIGSSF